MTTKNDSVKSQITFAAIPYIIDYKVLRAEKAELGLEEITVNPKSTLKTLIYNTKRKLEAGRLDNSSFMVIR